MDRDADGNRLPDVKIRFNLKKASKVICSEEGRPHEIKTNFNPACCQFHRDNQAPVSGWIFCVAQINAHSKHPAWAHMDQ